MPPEKTEAEVKFLEEATPLLLAKAKEHSAVVHAFNNECGRDPDRALKLLSGVMPGKERDASGEDSACAETTMNDFARAMQRRIMELPRGELLEIIKTSLLQQGINLDAVLNAVDALVSTAYNGQES